MVYQGQDRDDEKGVGMIVLKILGIIVFAVFALVACGALIITIRLYKLYNKRKCKYCGHYIS